MDKDVENVKRILVWVDNFYQQKVIVMNVMVILFQIHQGENVLFHNALPIQ